MARLGAHLRYFVRKKIAEDPAWQRPHIIFSGRLNFLAIIGDHMHVTLLYSGAQSSHLILTLSHWCHYIFVR